MLKISQFTLVASVILVFLALVCYILVLTLGRLARRQKIQKVLVHSGGGEGSIVATPTAPAPSRGLAMYGTYLTRLALLFLTGSLVTRAIETGHGPFANQYEFSVAFAWGMIAVYVYFEQVYRARVLALLILPVSNALLLYAMTVGATAVPLVPALQNNLLLSVHVALAIIAYGAFSVACAAAALHLIQPEGGRPRFPKPELLDEIAYRAVIIAFPLMTMVIILGSVWAQVAWGTYWSWDPKETASLFTWLIYGGYLHARVVHGWRGRRAAWLLMAGFAAVLFTFFGNLFFGGLHSYGKN